MSYTIKLKNPESEWRSGRMIVEGATACYHIVNRTVKKEFWFAEDKEKEVFRKILFRQAAFSGVVVLNYCLMSNHFHLLIRIPNRPDEAIDDEELMRRFIALYGNYHPFSVPEPELLRKILNENGSLAGEWRTRLKNRMGRLDVFMKELKQRFAIWYNKRNNNRGTLWAERYQSTLIEDHWHALSVVSAYIDLNPVRAKIVNDPAAYNYCGYAALMAGDTSVGADLASIYQSREGSENIGIADITEFYRLLLYEKGSRQKTGSIEAGENQGVIPEDIARQVIERRGKPALNEVLRQKAGYFSKGAIIGSRLFVNEIFDQNRNLFPPDRKSRGSPLRKGSWGDLCSLRNVRDRSQIPSV